MRPAELGEYDHVAKLRREVRRRRVEERDDAREAPVPGRVLCVRPCLVNDGEEDEVWVPPDRALEEGERLGERGEDEGVEAEDLLGAAADVLPVRLGVD